MIKINPYLAFNGEAEEAFNFYKSVFGGEFSSFQKFKDVPEADRKKGGIKDSESEKIINVGLPIGNEVLMASDSPESMGKPKIGGFSISVETDSKEEAEKIYKGLSTGGKITMPLGDTFWGAYYGMLTDKFGVHWMVSYTYPKK